MMQNTHNNQVATTVHPQQIVNRSVSMKRRLILFAVLIILVLVGAGFYFFKTQDTTPKVAPRTAEQNAYFDRASSLSQTQSNNPLIAANEIGTAGALYQKAGDQSRALEAFVHAQAILDTNKIPADQLNFYGALYSTYLKNGQKAEAKQYLQKDIHYLESQNPRDDTAIRDLKKKLDNL